ncbi:hypothetical protein VB636_17975, partial [Paracoccus sp. APAP_BH8]
MSRISRRLRVTFTASRFCYESRSTCLRKQAGKCQLDIGNLNAVKRRRHLGMMAICGPLHNEGHAVNVTRSRRLMRLMRLMPIRRKPAASRPAPGRKTYP